MMSGRAIGGSFLGLAILFAFFFGLVIVMEKCT